MFKDSNARRQMLDNANWTCIEAIVGLVSSGVPLVLKGALFRLLAALAIEERGAVKTWATMITFSIISRTRAGKLSGINVSFFFGVDLQHRLRS